MCIRDSTQYYADGRQINDEITADIFEHLKGLEEITGKKFGDNQNPLLVSDVYKRQTLARAASRSSTVRAQIISRTALMRSSAKNMCSVRHRPMPLSLIHI